MEWASLVDFSYECDNSPEAAGMLCGHEKLTRSIMLGQGDEDRTTH